MIDTTIKKIALKDLPEKHVFKHGAYVWVKTYIGKDSGGSRTSKTQCFWNAIDENTMVIPLVVGIKTND